MSSAKRALLFPGQGAQQSEMLTEFSESPRFEDRKAAVEAVLGGDVWARIESGERSYLDRNVVSSLMTVLASRLALDLYEAGDGGEATGFAGYSVGQWSALHASGALGFSDLVTVVHRRAELMDECVSRSPGGMLAVIGLRTEEIEEVCAALRARGLPIWIGNYNCVGQCSVSGSPAALEAALEELGARKPKKLIRLPVAGAWHSELIRDAAEPFHRFLKEIDIGKPKAPVVDNVSGDLLPEDPAELRRRLALQLYRPVRWEAGIRRLIQLGCGDLVEIGFGNTLTKFGFFIDRSVRHRTLVTDAAVGASSRRGNG